MNTRRTTRRIRQLVIAMLSAVAMAVSGVVAPPATQAAATTQIVFINAVKGPSAVDLYLDGTLTAPNVPFGAVTAPSELVDIGSHTVTLYPAISSPPSTTAGRSDTPLEQNGLFSQAVPGFFEHPDGLVVARLANSFDGDDFVTLIHDVPVSANSCTGLAGTSFSANADVSVRGPSGSGRGIFGVGGTSSGRTGPYTAAAVVQGNRSSELTGSELPYAFGTFNFGEVTYQPGTSTVYFAVGNTGSYGAAEVVVDCVADRFISTRWIEAAPTFDSSAFVPLEPERLFDTRTPEAPSGAVGPGETIDVQVTGQAGVPSSNVSAVVLNVTAVNAAGRGYVTVFPTGSPLPTTSSLNLLFAGQTVPNLVTVPVGDDGNVSFFSNSGTDLLADVSGYFVEADSAASGRFVPVAPDRVFDTRRAPAPDGALGSGDTITVEIAGANGVPTAGASAVVLNVTGISTGGKGFVTAWPTGGVRPTASNLNLSDVGDVAPNLVMVPLGDGGAVDFFASSGAHLFADVFGYFTDESAAMGSDGLFVPTSPARIFDSRPDEFGRFDSFIAADADIFVRVSGQAGVPAVGAVAVLANVTATRAAGRGFVTVWPRGTERPNASNLNLAFAGETRPNAAVVPLGNGDVSIYSQSGTHALFDVFGYFTG